MMRVALLVLLCAVGAYGASVTRRSSSIEKYDTIVVGLGASGTMAATTLARAGRHVLALEAQDRIGGRVNTLVLDNGIIEMGAEWIHGTEGSITYEIATNNSVEIKQQKAAQEFFSSDGTPIDGEELRRLVDFALENDLETNDDGTAGSVGQRVTRLLLEDLRIRNSPLLQDGDLLEGVVSFLNQMSNTHEASNDWKDVSTKTTSELLEGNQDMSWHINGYKTLFEILLNKYKGGPGLPTLGIKLNTEVTAISYPQQPEKPVLVTTRDGQVYTADNVIVTASVGVLKERYTDLFSPPLPEYKVTAIKNIDLGTADKVIFIYDKYWWPEEQAYYGFIWKKAQREQLSEDSKWLYYISGISTPMAYKYAITFWLTGETAKHVETLPDEVVTTKLNQLLSIFFANTTIPEPKTVLRSKWYTNRFTRGSYSFDSVNGAQYPTARADLARPLTDSAGAPRLLFAGEASEPRLFSTVHGATESGKREALRLLAKQ